MSAVAVGIAWYGRRRFVPPLPKPAPPPPNPNPSRGDNPVAKFEIGQKVQMPGVPFVVTVREIGECEDGDDCDLGKETFRFVDPQTGEPDWIHTAEFEAV